MMNFVKINEEMIININAIDGIFKSKHGHVVQLNGRDIDVDDITPILDAINMNSKTTSETTTTTATATNTNTFAKMVAAIRNAVYTYNANTHTKVDMTVDTETKTITIGTSKYSCIKIEREMIVEDTLSASTYSELKKKINEILL